MPPLLAALLMMELHCDLRIVQAIDLAMEWRKHHPHGCRAGGDWYAGFLGNVQSVVVGTYRWPNNLGLRRYRLAPLNRYK